ncbi:aldolase [Polychaeton citri CBS 116435]|uniref:deoxyribose-phosphate aldolase n=1 Tax=Polychaeton citri CBS 116435 TaxID=1314669 RepID=A0A9P4QGT8_9PEZI|nr:aldolase [Polychaeton citri CBS 116435]
MASLKQALLQLDGYTTTHALDQPCDSPTFRTPYANSEWSTFFAEVSKGLDTTSSPRDYPGISSADFNKTIDHTLLKVEAKGEQIDELCSEARTAVFATVCVRPGFVARAVSNLKGSDVLVASVVGFHEGTYDLEEKMRDSKQSLDAGAHELDIVLNYPALQKGDYSAIFNELATLRLQAPPPVLLKLIFESSQLTDAQITAACTLAAAAEFDYVKTSTGFKGHGATVGHVQLMAACCDKLAAVVEKEDASGKRKMKVKASGGVRTLDDAIKMLQAGASRLGTSAGVWIAKEAGERAEEVGKNGNALAPPDDNTSGRPGLQTRLYTDY